MYAAYARYDFSQPLAALALTAAVHGLLAKRAMSGSLVWLSAMFLTRPELGVLIGWIGGWLALDARRAGWRVVAWRVTAVVVSVLAAVALYLGANQARFGDWARTGHASASWLFAVSGPRLLEGALGLLLSPSHGLLIFHPLTWLAIPGLSRLIKDRHPAGLLWSGIVLMAFAFYAFYKGWWAGWSWGPRFLVPVLPLLTLAAAAFAAQSPRRGPRRLFVALAAAGVGVAGNGILLDFVLYYRWLEKVGGVPDSPASQFALVASPLVSGWRFLAAAPVDLLLTRMGEFGGALGTVAAVLIASVLLGALAWSGRLILAALREADAAEPALSS